MLDNMRSRVQPLLMNTIESLQRRLKAKGSDPGPTDGIDGPLTSAAWAAYQSATGAPNTTNGSPTSQDALSKLLARAKADVGVLSTSDNAGADHGELQCADAVTRILHNELGFSLPKTLSTDELYDELVSAGWKNADLRTPGAVIVSPSCSAMHGHTGSLVRMGPSIATPALPGVGRKTGLFIVG
jgi:peptidoglycan hydrolase-like protein with peptidoglycan-binding domain